MSAGERQKLAAMLRAQGVHEHPLRAEQIEGALSEPTEAEKVPVEAHKHLEEHVKEGKRGQKNV